MGHAGHVRTPEQLEALYLAFHALENAGFDHFLIVCSMKQEDDKPGQDPDVFYKGSFMMARVLAQHAVDKTTRNKGQNVRPRKPTTQ